MKKEMKEEYLLPRCKFCGKQMIADTVLQSDKEAEEYAVMHCDCEMARDYQEQIKKEKEKEENKKKIRDAVSDFAQYCEKKLYVFDPDAETLLISAGEAVLNGKIETIAVNVFGVKITISLSAKGKLKFKRSYKESAVVEVM